jgi:hypothetical protein
VPSSAVEESRVNTCPSVRIPLKIYCSLASCDLFIADSQNKATPRLRSSSRLLSSVNLLCLRASRQFVSIRPASCQHACRGLSMRFCLSAWPPCTRKPAKSQPFRTPHYSARTEENFLRPTSATSAAVFERQILFLTVEMFSRKP